MNTLHIYIHPESCDHKYSLIFAWPNSEVNEEIVIPAHFTDTIDMYYERDLNPIDSWSLWLGLSSPPDRAISEWNIYKNGSFYFSSTDQKILVGTLPPSVLDETTTIDIYFSTEATTLFQLSAKVLYDPNGGEGQITQRIYREWYPANGGYIFTFLPPARYFHKEGYVLDGWKDERDSRIYRNRTGNPIQVYAYDDRLVTYHFTAQWIKITSRSQIYNAEKQLWIPSAPYVWIDGSWKPIHANIGNNQIWT